jgi:hypothetical protein
MMLVTGNDAMAAPSDSDTVLATIRLGWYIAEVRGRNRPYFQPSTPLNLPGRTNHELPLQIERTSPELSIEAQTVLKALATQIGVDTDSSGSSFSAKVEIAAKRLAQAVKAAETTAGPTGRDGSSAGGGAGSAGGSAGSAGGGAGSAEMAGSRAGAAVASPGAGGGVVAAAGDQANAGNRVAEAMRGLLGMARTAGTGDGATKAAATETVAGDWDALEEVIYKFDAHIQDTLAMRPPIMGCAYQLGRVLAESYWSLDPSLATGSTTWDSWKFLFGQERCDEIGRQLGRLSAYFHPYTAAGIAGSVRVWQNVATSPEWQQIAYPKLYQQIRRWYELLLLKQDPTTIIQPYQLLRNYRLVWRTLRGFWFQLLLAALAAGAVAVFAWLLTKPDVASWIKTLLATFGIAGISVAGLAAKVKNEAQALLARLKEDAYTDLIAESITTAPLPPASVKAPKSGAFRPITKKGKMASMIRQREITPVTPV